MRRALLRQMPAFSALFGLRPADFDEMTAREAAEYVRAYRAHVAERGG